MLWRDALESWRDVAYPERSYMAPNTFVSTGIPAFDRFQRGGFRSGALTMIGRHRLGKTALLMAAMHAAGVAKLPVVLIGVRDPTHTLTSRLIAAATRIDMGKVNGGFASGDEWSRIQLLFDGGVPAWIRGAPLRSPPRRLVEDAQVGLDQAPALVLVDDVDDLGPARDGELEKLRSMAQRRRFALVCTTRQAAYRNQMADELFDLMRCSCDETDRFTVRVMRCWPDTRHWCPAIQFDKGSGALIAESEVTED